MADPHVAHPLGEQISIIGLACRFPEAASPREFLELCLTGRRAFRRIPPVRLDEAEYGAPGPGGGGQDRWRPGNAGPFRAALIEGWRFDRAAFGVTESVYRAVDPAHWLALETASRALADGGFPGGQGLVRDRTGVVIGNTLTGDVSRAKAVGSRWPYVRRALRVALAAGDVPPEARSAVLDRAAATFLAPFPEISDESLAGSAPSAIADRICGHFGFRGGGHVVDAAHSSGLLAVALACSALAAHDLDTAVAGGVDISLDPFELAALARTGVLADQQMRVFDARPTGFWPGEGCGLVVLMRTADARAANVPVYADIAGWGVSSSGNAALTSPGSGGLLLALQRAHHRGGVDPADVALIEGDGTGTASGDLAELTSLAEIRAGAPGLAALGSVKANIGHTKAAAGAAGLIKTTLAMAAGVIPPTTGCVRPHALITNDDARVRVPAAPEPWAQGPRTAGVSAVGPGGTSIHLILRRDTGSGRRWRPPVPTRPHGCARPGPGSRPERTSERQAPVATPRVEAFTFAAADRRSLTAELERIAELAPWLSDAELHDLACQAGRVVASPAAARVALVAATQDELADLARDAIALLPGLGGRRLVTAPGIFAAEGARGRVTLLFPGEGTLPERPASRTPPGRGDGADPARHQAVLRASMDGLRWLDRLGVSARAGVGHGLGEITGLVWAGCLREADADRMVFEHGVLLGGAATEPAGLVCVDADEQAARAVCTATGLVIVAYNGPRCHVLAGPPEAAHEAVERLAHEGVPARFLTARRALHSPAMAGLVPPLRRMLAKLAFQPPARRLLSTITGTELTSTDDIPALLCAQLTSPVRFAGPLTLAAAQTDLLLETGPGGELSLLAADCCDAPAVSLSARGADDEAKVAAALFAAGAVPSLAPVLSGRPARPVDIWRERVFIASPCGNPAPSGIMAASPAEPRAAGASAEPAAAVAHPAWGEPTPGAGTMPLPPVSPGIRAQQHPAHARHPARPHERYPAMIGLGAVKDTRTAHESAAAHLEGPAFAQAPGSRQGPVSAHEPGSTERPGPASERGSAQAPRPAAPSGPSMGPQPTAEPRPAARPRPTAEPRPAAGPGSAQRPLPSQQPGPASGSAPDTGASGGTHPEPTFTPGRHRATLPHPGGRAAPSSHGPAGSGEAALEGVAPWVRVFAERLLTAEPAPQHEPDAAWRLRVADRQPFGRIAKGIFDHDPGAGCVLAVPGDLTGPEGSATLLDAAREAADVGRLVVITPHDGLAGFCATLHAEHPSVGITLIRSGAGAEALRAARRFAIAEPGRFRQVVIGEKGTAHEPVPMAAEPVGGGPFPLGPADVVLVAGVTDVGDLACAAALASRGSALAVIAAPGPEDPRMTALLADLRSAGTRVGRKKADPTDPGQVAATVRSLERGFGPVTAIVHGAATGPIERCLRLPESALRNLLAGQRARLSILLSSVAMERVRLLVTFGSIAAHYGRVEGACDALTSGLLPGHARELAGGWPRCQLAHIDLPPWAGQGSGPGPGTRRGGRDVEPVPVGDGSRLLLDVLSTPGFPSRIAVHGRVGLPAPAGSEQRAGIVGRHGRFLAHPRLHYPGIELIMDTRLSLTHDPYLADHRVDGLAVLPLAMALEAMAQGASALADKPLRSLAEVSMPAPVVFPGGPGDSGSVIRVCALRREDTVETVLRCAETGFRVDHVRATFRMDAPQSTRSHGPDHGGGNAGLDSRGQQADTGGALPGGIVDGTDLYGPVYFQGGRFRRVAFLPQVSSRSCRALVRGGDDQPWFGADSGPAQSALILGSPGLNDATLHVLQACTPHRRVLPAGCDSLTVSGREVAGALHVRAVRRPAAGDEQEDAGIPADDVWDVTAADATGAPVVVWTGARLLDVGPLARSSPWHPTLLAACLETRAAELGIDPRLRAAISSGHRSAQTGGADPGAGEAPRTLDLVPSPGRPGDPPTDPPGAARTDPSGPARTDPRESWADSATGRGPLRGFELSVSASRPVACRWEAVGAATPQPAATVRGGPHTTAHVTAPATTPPEHGLAYLGPRLRQRLSKALRETPESVDARVRTISACLAALGHEPSAGPVLEDACEGGWVVVRAGDATVGCAVVEMNDVQAPVALAIATRTPAASRDTG